LVLAACTPASNPVASFLQKKKAAVFVFLAPDCPLSQNYTLTLNKLAKDYEPKGIGFYGVFSGDAISKTAMDEFGATYHVGFPMMLDPQEKIADYFGATNTPEAFLTDPHGRTLYKRNRRLGSGAGAAPHGHHATLFI
jgi:thiol-disulfide isomerase/thioredoxin